MSWGGSRWSLSHTDTQGPRLVEAPSSTRSIDVTEKMIEEVMSALLCFSLGMIHCIFTHSPLAKTSNMASTNYKWGWEMWASRWDV